ncbi:PAS domain S-box protein [Aquibacillus koreensis]|uniref:histidine kinase n=1 Tax=Aquibacillus koreensis TaxID=279446 RepID=A0A9X3WLA1_9BACI|nr:PAS domain S-box protein [Aquibacillus koreensis]MCT2535895.1 PAS domain S-box protein [Aquibacillus koreensis]MDC3420351.1 PAS domain S-box protein [Aquibacillus koreensis]
MRKTDEIQVQGEAPGDATIVINHLGKIHSINQKASQVFSIREEEYTGNDLQQLLPDLDLTQVKEGTIIQHYLINREGKRFPLFLRINKFRINNEAYWILVMHRGNDFSVSGMEPQRVLTELLDIKYALDQSTIVAITDQRGKIKYVNEKFCEISQYSEEELIGQDHRIINSGYHSKSFIKNLWRTIANGKVWKGEVKNKAKDGSYYWVDTTIVPFLTADGKPHQYLAIRKEITEHKRVVNELKKSVEELVDIKFALDESSIVAITDRRGRITYVNDQFVRVSKYSREELIGNTHNIINSGFHPRSFFKDLWRTIGTGKVWKGEIKNQAKDGNYYWVDTTIVPFLDEDGKPYQYLSIRFDITKRKKVEEELQKTMTRIIDVEEDERKRLSREIHDGIGQNLYSHLITINRLSVEVDHPLVNQMLDEATNLIQEVRDFSWELRPSVLDDLGLVPAIRSFLNRFSESYQIDVLFNCYLNQRPSSDVEITIYRIIQEALTNIRKYAEVEHATVTLREDGNTIRVVIEDEGKGFVRDQLNAGVGLISMEERAKSVNGDFDISSEPGKGTIVVLEITT